MNLFRNDNSGMLVAAIVDDASINYNLDAEITGFEGNLNVFLSENTSVMFNWLAIENEVTSDTSLINYLNPLNSYSNFVVESLSFKELSISTCFFIGTTTLLVGFIPDFYNYC